MTENNDILELLDYIDPSSLSYQDWVNVGMALKHEGYSVSDWDNWSSKDPARYHDGECKAKWKTFTGTSTPVTGGTIVQMAKDNGWTPLYKIGDQDYELEWDSVIKDEHVVIDKDWIEGKEIIEPETWNPVQQLITYLETLFDSTENVGFVTKSWEKDGRYMPTKGVYDRTAGKLIEELSKCNDIREVIADYNEEVGAWIRFNPVDGKGVKNDNVTEFRYALVESDSMDLSKQNAIIRELELPVACLVHSGGKSIHAIVHIDAPDYSEYRKRVDFLYSICKKNGLEIDTQNKNPSRLSRMPGIMRKGHKQFIIDTKIGKADWNEWKEWIDSVNDDLPDPESLADYWDNLPELAKPLIDGVLRQGHKMLIAGPSKAGKSFALIEMCIAIAEGKKWLNWQCTQGKVMYVNLELDRASCLHRFKDVYTQMNLLPTGLKNIDIWNLRGKSIPMDKLAPKLIRRASKKNYIAIVIDPIYKVITGDENSADQMSNFCNQFDKVCTELGVSVIYCHHHSKGSQGSKRSMDRASGSGVFARDPDALLDMIELNIPEGVVKQQDDRMICAICERWLKEVDKLHLVSLDERCSASAMLKACRDEFGADGYKLLSEDIATHRAELTARTAWRIEGTLREFPKFAPVNLWFEYPVHVVDDTGILQDIDTDEPIWKKASDARKKKAKSENKNSQIEMLNAYESIKSTSENGEVTLNDLADYFEIQPKAVKKRMQKEDSVLGYDNGKVYKKSGGTDGTNQG